MSLPSYRLYTALQGPYNLPPLLEPSFSTDWFTPNIPIWGKHLAYFKGKPNLRFLEIGSWEGRSACWLLQNILTDPSSSLTCIDLFELDLTLERRAADAGLIPPIPLPKEASIEQRFDVNIRAVGAEQKVVKLKGRSQELLRALPLDSYDCIYIDGSHLATDVLSDTILGWDLLHDGGLLLFDDYHLKMFAQPYHNPRIAIDAFLAVFPDHYTLLHQEWQVILRKCSRKDIPHFATTPLQRTEESKEHAPHIS